MVDGERNTEQFENLTVAEFPHLIRFGEFELATGHLCDHRSGLLGQPEVGIGEHGAVIGVDVGRHLARTAHGDHREGVVEVAMCQQHGSGS